MPWRKVFFHSLNVELIHGKLYETLQDAKTAVFEYIHRSVL